MNKNYVLYGRQGGGSLIIQFLLEELGATYRIEWVDKDAASDPSSPYRKICPTGKIPALVLPDGTSMFESAAICIHLTDTHPEAKLAPPRGSSDHAHFLQWMLFLATGVYGSVLRFYYAPRYTAQNDGNGVKETALAEFEEHLSLIESQLSGFLAGSALTAADFYLYMLAGWHPDGYEAVQKKFPKVGALCETVGARATVKRVMDQNN